MAKLVLSKDDATKLLDFCNKHELEEWFVAKDQGAYVGASTGEGGNCIFFFPGCDPTKDEDWYDAAVSLFGGDDFGEHIPVSTLRRLVEVAAKRVTVIVTPTQIRFGVN